MMRLLAVGKTIRYNATMCDTKLKKRGVFTAEVIGNEKLCAEHYLLRLRLAAFPPTAAGQFVQVQCRPPVEQVGHVQVEWSDTGTDAKLPKFTQPELTDREPLLRRPFSLAGRREVAGGVELDIIYRQIGVGTGWLAGVAADVTVSLIGPLGNAFTIPETKSTAVLIGGGVGIPPMMYLAETLSNAGKDVVAFCGVRSQHLFPLTLRPGCEEELRTGRPTQRVEEFAQRGAAAVIASDDGTVGYHGLVTDALLRWLRESGVSHDDLVAYSCGPEPMMRAVGDLCIELGIECHLSLERNMACGMGTCQSCIVRIRDDSEAGWSYKLCCTHGPVFNATDIVWE